MFSVFIRSMDPTILFFMARKRSLDHLPGINRFLIGNEEGPYKLQPGNVNYELTYGLLGVVDYFKAVNNHLKIHSVDNFKELFNQFALHEEKLASLLLDFLNNKRNVKYTGHSFSHRNTRVPTISFTIDNKKSSEIPIEIDKHQIGIRYGDFYARRLIEDLGLSKKMELSGEYGSL